jgi:hypothetical protein
MSSSLLKSTISAVDFLLDGVFLCTVVAVKSTIGESNCCFAVVCSVDGNSEIVDGE